MSVNDTQTTQASNTAETLQPVQAVPEVAPPQSAPVIAPTVPAPTQVPVTESKNLLQKFESLPVVEEILHPIETVENVVTDVKTSVESEVKAFEERFGQVSIETAMHIILDVEDKLEQIEKRIEAFNAKSSHKI